MHNIKEVPVTQLEEVVSFVNQHWNEVSRRPQASSIEKELSFWQEILRTQRILVYRGENGDLQALLTFTKMDNDVWVDHFIVEPGLRGQGIGIKMLQMAERLAHAWTAKRIILKGREDQGDFLDYFQRLGYGFHCPIGEKGHITLEKRIN